MRLNTSVVHLKGNICPEKCFDEMFDKVQTKNAKVVEQAGRILPWLSEDACSSLFKVCEVEEKIVHHCSA